jgi:hypothetical protein
MQPTQHPEIRSMFGAILDRLTQSFPTPGGAFLLHYATRNRTNERSVGLSGVEHSALLNTYANALDKAYAHFTSSNENWDKPVKPTGFAAIPVYVTRPETHTLDPFTLTKRGQSSVWLRCLIHEANIDMMLLRAELDALHEVTHLFTHRHHPPSSNPFDPWKWFDEATAVYMERRLGSHIGDCVRYGVYWSYGPEQALNLMMAEGGGYLACWFVQYLADRFGPKLIRDVWHTREAVGPITCLDTLLRQQHNCGIRDVYGNYACQTYLYQDFALDVHLRFGERSIAQWFSPGLGRPFGLSGSDALDPFACRYYRLDVPAGATQLDVSLRVVSSPSDNVRASLLLVANGAMASQVNLAPKIPGDERLLTCKTLLPRVPLPDHATLVVMNVPPAMDLQLHDPVLVREYTFDAIF